MPTVSKEVARAEFERFADAMDLDLDSDNMTAEDNEANEKQIGQVVKAIETGHVTIDEQGQPTVFLKVPTNSTEKLTFFEPDGAVLLALDSKKENASVSKMFSMIQAMTHTPEGTLAKVKQRDLKVIQGLASLFLG